MFAATLPSDASPTAGTHGIADVRFGNRNGRTHLVDLYQRSPLRVLFPGAPEGELTSATIVTTSGGLVGGDRLGITIGVDDGARAQVTAQAAEKAYRSAGSNCTVELRLRVGRDAWLEWLPQETILFEGTRLHRMTTADVTSGGRLLAGEMLVFGRTARGECLTHGLVRDDWNVRIDGRLVWVDALNMDGDLVEPLNRSAGFGGAKAYATAVYVGQDAGRQLAVARDLIECEGVRCGATVIGDVLIVRWLGEDGLQVRNAFGAFWSGFRRRVAALPSSLPRLWVV